MAKAERSHGRHEEDHDTPESVVNPLSEGSASMERMIPSLPPQSRQALQRFARVLAGLGLMIAGLLVIENAYPYLPLYLKNLNTTYRFDIQTLEGLIIGLPLIGIGLFVLLRATRKSPYQFQSSQTSETVGAGSIFLPAASRRWFVIGIIGIAFVNLHVTLIAYQPYVIWLFFASLAALLYGHVVWDRERGQPPTASIKRSDAFAVLGLMLLGLIIFTYRLADIPSVLIGDEAAFFTHAKRLAEGATEPHPFGFSTYSFPAMATYVQAATLRLFGTTLWAWRFASVLPSILAIPALYWLTTELTDRRTAIGACVLFISLPFTLSYSRLGYNISQVFPLLAAGGAALLVAEREGSRSWAFTAGVIAGFGSLTYLSGRIIPLAALFYFAGKGLFDKSHRRRYWLLGAIFLLGALLTMSPHLIFGTLSDRPSLGTKISESLFSNQHYILSLQPAETLADARMVEFNGYKHVLDPALLGRLTIRGIVRTVVVFFEDSLLYQHFLVGPIAGRPTYLFAAIGLAALTRKKLRSPIHFLTLWLIAGLLTLSVLNTFPPRPSHLSGILPLLPFFAAAGLTLLTVDIQDCLPRLGRLGATILFALMVSSLAVVGLRDYFVEMPQKYSPDIESAMAWSGMAAPDRTIVYAHTIPDQASQVPFLFTAFPIDVPYVNAYIAEDESLQGQLPTQGEIAIFSQPPDAEEVRRLIRENWDGPIFNETVADPNGKVLVQIFKNRDFPAFPDRSFSENLVYSYWQTPVKWIILVIPLIGILINFSSVLYRRTRSAVIRFLIWLTKPEADS